MNLRSGNGIRLWLLAFSLAVLSLVAGPAAMAAGCFGASPLPAHAAARAAQDHHMADLDKAGLNKTGLNNTGLDQTDHDAMPGGDHAAKPGCASHGCCAPQLVVQRVMPPAQIARADLALAPPALQPWRQASGLFRPPRPSLAKA